MILKILLTCLIAISSISLLTSYFDSQIKSDLLKKINQETPQWIIDQISLDLKNASPMTNDMFEKTFQNYAGYIVKYKIKSGKIETQFNDPKWVNCCINGFMNYFLEELNSYVGLPDVEFLIVLEDKVLSDQCLVPILAFCRKLEDTNIVLVPDYQIFHCLQKEQLLDFVESNILNKVSEAVKQHPWNEKIHKGIWRGADTDGNYRIDNYSDFPRAKLLNLSNLFPDILDAKFNVLHCRDNAMISKFYELNYVGSSMSIFDQLRYKYQILMDGVTCSWPGAFWRFHSNSVVFKQTSNYIQWYYSILEPFVHYIPFTHDAENLIDMIEWAKNNDEQVNQIVQNANEICSKCLTYVDILYYFYIVLKNYANLQKSFAGT